MSLQQDRVAHWSVHGPRLQTVEQSSIDNRDGTEIEFLKPQHFIINGVTEEILERKRKKVHFFLFKNYLIVMRIVILIKTVCCRRQESTEIISYSSLLCFMLII